jgi:hypothetical protein
LLNVAYPPPDDAGPYGPFGPVIRQFVEQMLNPQPLPPKAGPVPHPWVGAAAGSAMVRYALDRQELAESVGARNDSLGAGIQKFVDDFCGTPPRLYWPFPWPRPKWWDLAEGQVGAVDVLVAAAQFHRVAETMPDNALAPYFDEGANTLFETGLHQLGG